MIPAGRNLRALLLAAACVALLLLSIHSARASHWSGWWGWVEHDFTGYAGKPIMDVFGPFLSEKACLDMVESYAIDNFQTVEDFDCEWTDKMNF